MRPNVELKLVLLFDNVSKFHPFVHVLSGKQAPPRRGLHHARRATALLRAEKSYLFLPRLLGFLPDVALPRIFSASI